ncbi:MAG: hypothetical protein J5976_03860 [Bacteroidales bacterium]|nr:hypothetical protein [Bacteroidales bacterium]
MEKTFGKKALMEPLSIKDKVTTFEDACKLLNLPETDNRLQLIASDLTDKRMKAGLQLEIIIEAINEGWKFTPLCGKIAWWPWHFVYSKHEIENMSEDLRKKNIQMYVDNYDNLLPDEFAGLGFAHSYNAWSVSYSSLGSRLALKSEDLAVYVGRMFPELYYDWLWS